MAEFHELLKRYESLPLEMRTQKRWICFAVRSRNGESIKIPMSTKGESALSEDPEAWDTFENAVKYCAEHGLDGIGFEFEGSGFVGIDLKNKKDESGYPVMSEQAFREMTNDFVKTLNSYTEWSVSKNGIHIIIKGEAPDAENLNPNIEVHAGNRYFAMTGNCVRRRSVSEKSDELNSLVAKYGKAHLIKDDAGSSKIGELESFTDEQVLERARKHKNGPKFSKLFSGDISDYGSQEDARQALCNFLAYFSNCDSKQVDRLFRNSALFDGEWDFIGDKLIQKSIETCAKMLIGPSGKSNVGKVTPKSTNRQNLDEEGNPIFYEPCRPLAKYYDCDDTGNARMFYDYFGDYFRYDVKNCKFMFWTGKTWINDDKEIIKQYANRLIEICKDKLRQFKSEIETETNDERRKAMTARYEAEYKNVKRLSNKAGKEAMLSEFRALGKTGVLPTEFNLQPELLNTDSGVVNLRTGEILPWDKDYMMSFNTKCKVSMEKSEAWEKFLADIFDHNGDEEATKAIVECFQLYMGHAITGYVKEEFIGILDGKGSNGKSTMIERFDSVLGDYIAHIDSSQVMVKKNANPVALQNSMAELIGVRVLVMSETEEGERFSEKIVKQITGTDIVNAQRKFGHPFSFRPVFKPLMMTNNLPIIRGKDYGIWRRILLFKFLRIFTEETKDKNMKEKLEADKPKILGWLIQGAKKYLERGDIALPDILKDEVKKYKQSVDTVEMFINSECYVDNSKATPKNALYDAYVRYCESSKLPAMSKPKFSVDMEEKGYKAETSHDHSLYYQNIALRDPSIGTKATYRQSKEISPFDD